jgi:N-acylglucosamine-6-phosphate 2-epimerase
MADFSLHVTRERRVSMPKEPIMASAIGSLKGKLIVSCQPAIGGPMDYTDMVVAFARAAQVGGAGDFGSKVLKMFARSAKLPNCPS